jgi:hypothetical protein
MLKLFFIVLAAFGLWVGLGQYFPQLFQQGFFIPSTKVHLTYITVIMAVFLLGSFSWVTVKS